ncbi:DNA-binding protein [Paraburkholderia sp. C35]|uniref:helix-turn-helix transcriptional regulator n=1 Tax=Paraburkholderia sp. C35 TaxID=2126993 RepID=UPI000D68FD8C|nr:DNA-binding protein [Paraburkholderia sp. C35]
MEYTFTLKYRLSADDRDHDEIIERLAAEGCDDATVGVGQPGRLALAFARESKSATHALVSALKDVRRAVPGAQLVEAAPDFVGLTDVAEVTGVSRQNMRKLMQSHATEFPSPVHEGSTSLWHLSDVLEWMHGRGGYDIAPEVFEVAQSAKQLNLMKEARDLQPKVTRHFNNLVA